MSTLGSQNHLSSHRKDTPRSARQLPQYTTISRTLSESSLRLSCPGMPLTSPRHTAEFDGTVPVTSRTSNFSELVRVISEL